MGREKRVQPAPHRVERDTEDEIVAWAEDEGGEALKLKIDGLRGFPDRTLLFAGALVLFVETKTPTNKTSPQQDRWIKRLRELGFVVEVARTLAEAKEALWLARAEQKLRWRKIIDDERRMVESRDF